MIVFDFVSHRVRLRIRAHPWLRTPSRTHLAKQLTFMKTIQCLLSCARPASRGRSVVLYSLPENPETLSRKAMQERKSAVGGWWSFSETDVTCALRQCDCTQTVWCIEAVHQTTVRYYRGSAITTLQNKCREVKSRKSLSPVPSAMKRGI